jgi:hypothetical protein
MRVGNRTQSIGVSSGNSGVGSIRSRSVIHLACLSARYRARARQSYKRLLTLTLQRAGFGQPRWLLALEVLFRFGRALEAECVPMISGFGTSNFGDAKQRRCPRFRRVFGTPEEPAMASIHLLLDGDEAHHEFR